MPQMPRTRVRYNADCPICNSEMCSYAAYSTQNALPLAFDDLNTVDLSQWGISADDAARLLHVIHDGRLHIGFDAFLVLWSQMPRYRRLAKIGRWPVVFPVLNWGYANVVARLIYARHLRRGRLGLRP